MQSTWILCYDSIYFEALPTKPGCITLFGSKSTSDTDRRGDQYSLHSFGKSDLRTQVFMHVDSLHWSSFHIDIPQLESHVVS